MGIQKVVLWSKRSTKGHVTWNIYMKKDGHGLSVYNVGQKRADKILEAAQ